MSLPLTDNDPGLCRTTGRGLSYLLPAERNESGGIEHRISIDSKGRGRILLGAQRWSL